MCRKCARNFAEIIFGLLFFFFKFYFLLTLHQYNYCIFCCCFLCPIISIFSSILICAIFRRKLLLKAEKTNNNPTTMFIEVNALPATLHVPFLNYLLTSTLKNNNAYQRSNFFSCSYHLAGKVTYIKSLNDNTGP